jgi:hypothetical protein
MIYREQSTTDHWLHINEMQLMLNTWFLFNEIAVLKYMCLQYVSLIASEKNSSFLIKTYKFYYQMTIRPFANSNSELKLEEKCNIAKQKKALNKKTKII